MQMPLVQPGPQPEPQSEPQSAQSYGVDNAMGQPMMTSSSSIVQPAQPAQPESNKAPEKKSNSSLIIIIVIVIVSLIAVTFIGLFIWILLQYNGVSEDVEGQISMAVAEAKLVQAKELEEEFAEREKEPFRDFAGPIDYGQLSFKYPKTWSLYVESDASKGGDYKAYFNPIEVLEVSDTTVNALRLTIRDRDFATVAEEYQKAMDKKDSNLSMEITSVAGTTANRYTGVIPKTELKGIVVIFKIRDKTAILQTDSMFFEEDFNKILETIQFNV